MRQPTVLGPEDGDLFDVAGDRVRLLADGSGTDSKYGLLEAIIPPGGGPPPHSHTREEEGFYILDGEITVHVDGQTIIGRTGSFVNLPKGSVHCFCNDTDRVARMLVVVAPGGFEHWFREIGVPVAHRDVPTEPVTEEHKSRALESAIGYGLEFHV